MDLCYNLSWSLAGSSLQCYSCKTKLSNSNCQATMNCKENEMCKTDVISKAKRGWTTWGRDCCWRLAWSQFQMRMSAPPILDTSGGVGQQSSAFIPESYLVRKG